MTPVDDPDAAVHDLRVHHDRFLEALRDLGHCLRTTHERSEIVSRTLRVTAGFLRVPTAVFYAQAGGTRRLIPTEWLGVPGDVPPVELSPGEGLAGGTSQAQTACTWTRSAPPATTTSGGVLEPSPSEPAGNANSALALPVRSGGHPFGVLAFYGRSVPEPFGNDDRAALGVLVAQAEAAIESSFLYDETTRLSLTDGLTGLWNRRQFDLRMGSELSRAVRFSEPFSILFADIDKFKAVNDSRGHQAGDTVLIEVARRLSEVTREVDVVARYGGEEFTLLLPRTGLAGAERLGEKVRAAIEDQAFALDDGSVEVTISIGVAAYPEHGSSAKLVLAAADQALYRAKAAGGNRVEPAGHGGEQVEMGRSGE